MSENPRTNAMHHTSCGQTTPGDRMDCMRGLSTLLQACRQADVSTRQVSARTCDTAYAAGEACQARADRCNASHVRPGASRVRQKHPHTRVAAHPIAAIVRGCPLSDQHHQMPRHISRQQRSASPPKPRPRGQHHALDRGKNVWWTRFPP